MAVDDGTAVRRVGMEEDVLTAEEFEIQGLRAQIADLGTQVVYWRARAIRSEGQPDSGSLVTHVWPRESIKAMMVVKHDGSDNPLDENLARMIGTLHLQGLEKTAIILDIGDRYVAVSR